MALPAVVLRAVARGPRRRGAAGLMLLGGMAEQAAAKSTKVNLEEEVLGEKLPLEDRSVHNLLVWSNQRIYQLCQLRWMCRTGGLFRRTLFGELRLQPFKWKVG